MKKIDIDVLCYDSYFENIEQQDLPELGMFFVCKSMPKINIGKLVALDTWMMAELMQHTPTESNDFNDDFDFDDVGHFHWKKDAIFAAECFERKRVMDKINAQVGN